MFASLMIVWFKGYKQIPVTTKLNKFGLIVWSIVHICTCKDRFEGVNTASASKVGKFKPFLGEVKKLKGPLMGILVFKYSNVKVRLLRQHWMHFVRDHSARWMLQMRRYKRGPFRRNLNSSS